MKHGTIRRTAGRQTRARAPQHRAGTAHWGSHGEHWDAPRGTDGALPLTGVWWCGALGRGEAPLGSPWRRPCHEQEEAPRVKRGGGLHPARPDCWLPTKGPWATPGGLFTAGVKCLSRREGVPPCLRTSRPLGGTLEVHRTSWRIPFPWYACTFLVLGFRAAWVSHAPPRVPKQRRP